jgi:hypothetical protein
LVGGGEGNAEFLLLDRRDHANHAGHVACRERPDLDIAHRRKLPA